MKIKFLTENLMIKVFSLTVSLLLFFVVTSEDVTPVDVDFRLTYRFDDDIVVIDDAPQVLHTTLQGPWANFRSFGIEELTPVTLDLRGNGPGTLRHRIETDDVDPPAGMRVVAIRPAEIELTLDRQIERQVPVQIDITDRPALGYEILNVTIDPPRVPVLGPMTMVQAADFVFTRGVDVGGREDGFTVDVDLRAPQSPMRLKTRRVTVIVELGEEFVERRFPEASVEIRNAPTGAKVIPATVDISLKGPRRIVDAMRKEQVHVYVDAADEIERGLTRFEKSIDVDQLPERTIRVGIAPRVRISIPGSRRRRRMER